MTTDAFIKKMAKEAGEAVWKRFGKDGAFYMKSEYSFDVVTKADLMADKMIVSAIRKAYPAHGIIAEESGKFNENADYVWIIDPIDGTKNFSNRIPLFAVMIALAHKKRVILSAVYLPVTQELYFAKSGKGAFLNGTKIRRSPQKDFKRSEGLCQLNLGSRNTTFLSNLLLLKNTRHFSIGSYKCMGVNAAYVAAGRRDWVVALYGGVYDFAAPYLILKESGCTVTNLKGEPWTLDDLEIVAANPTLHRQLIKLTKNV